MSVPLLGKRTRQPQEPTQFQLPPSQVKRQCPSFGQLAPSNDSLITGMVETHLSAFPPGFSSSSSSSSRSYSILSPPSSSSSSSSSISSTALREVLPSTPLQSTPSNISSISCSPLYTLLWQLKKNLASQLVCQDESRAIKLYLEMINSQDMAGLSLPDSDSYLDPYLGLIYIYEARNTPEGNTLAIQIYDRLLGYFRCDSWTKAEISLNKGRLLEKDKSSDSLDQAIEWYRIGLKFLEEVQIDSSDDTLRQLDFRLAIVLLKRNRNELDLIESIDHYNRSFENFRVDDAFSREECADYLTSALSIVQNRMRATIDVFLRIS